jgi:hypothetical protein
MSYGPDKSIRGACSLNVISKEHLEHYETIADEVYAAFAGENALSLTVANKTGGTLAQGTLVYIDGYDATLGYITVAKADANAAGLAAMLVIDAPILNNATGEAYRYATVTGSATVALDTSAATVDDPVYLSATAGEWTLVDPAATAAITQIVGRVTVKSATVGEIFFYPGGSGAKAVGSNELQAGVALANLISGGSIAGTVVASKAVVASADKDIGAFRTISATGLSLASTSPVSHPINLEGVTLPSNCNAIRGASVNPTRTSGWTSFSGTVSTTPAQVYSDYRNLITTGVAEVLGIGSFPMMAAGASCASMFAGQFICQVDAGATVLTAAGAPAVGIFPIFAKLLLDGETFNSGGVAAAIFASVQANVTDVSGQNVSVFNVENASGNIKDIFYFKATSGYWRNFFTFAAEQSPVLAWGADAANCAGAPDKGLRTMVGAVEYWIPMYVNT